jgi:hypothetical protein
MAAIGNGSAARGRVSAVAVATAILLGLVAPTGAAQVQPGGAADAWVDGAEPQPDAAGATQQPDTSIGWVPLPVVAYRPETSLMLGAASVFTFYVQPPVPTPGEDRIRRSSLEVAVAATLKRRYSAAVRPTLYFDGETWELCGLLEALWFPQTFWGGNDTPDAAEEDYTKRHLGSQHGLIRVLVFELSGGLMTSVHHLTLVNAQARGADRHRRGARK